MGRAGGKNDEGSQGKFWDEPYIPDQDDGDDFMGAYICQSAHYR